LGAEGKWWWLHLPDHTAQMPESRVLVEFVRRRLGQAGVLEAEGADEEEEGEDGDMAEWGDRAEAAFDDEYAQGVAGLVIRQAFTALREIDWGIAILVVPINHGTL